MQIGRIIKIKRLEKGISQQKLSEGICSKEYVYLVENGKRQPSVEIIRAFSIRLDTDFFEYMPYLDYQEPIVVYDFMKSFEDMKTHRNYKGLHEKCLAAATHPDFQKGELVHELEYNRIIYKFAEDENLDEAYDAIQKALASIGCSNEIKDCDLSLCHIKYYNLLAIYHNMIEDYETQYQILSKLYKIVNVKRVFNGYDIHYMSIALNFANTLLVRKDYSEVMTICKDILSFETTFLNKKKHLVYYLMGMAQKGLGQDGSEAIKKCYYHALANDLIEELQIINSGHELEDFKRMGVLKVDLEAELAKRL